MTRTDHPQSPADRTAMTEMRAYLQLQPEMSLTSEGRPAYDAFIGAVPAAESVAFNEAVIGGVGGWWCKPDHARADVAMLYIHGGAFTLGSAGAYRNVASHLARAARAMTFVPDYALAPEKPFPEALKDIQSVLHGLHASGFARVAVVGDSAGAGLALSIVHGRQTEATADFPVIEAVVAMSPWADLTLTSPSIAQRADADPILSRAQLQAAVGLYAGDGQDLHDPRLSPRFGPMNETPPTMIHVGADEILLDDALAYRDVAEVHVWAGMTHVFPASIQSLQAARDAMGLMGAFLRAHLSGDS